MDGGRVERDICMGVGPLPIHNTQGSQLGLADNNQLLRPQNAGPTPVENAKLIYPIYTDSLRLYKDLILNIRITILIRQQRSILLPASQILLDTAITLGINIAIPTQETQRDR